VKDADQATQPRLKFDPETGEPIAANNENSPAKSNSAPQPPISLPSQTPSTASDGFYGSIAIDGGSEAALEIDGRARAESTSLPEASAVAGRGSSSGFYSTTVSAHASVGVRATTGMVRVFRQKSALEDATEFHAFAPLEALAGV
jgi:hypothetical protein